MWSHHRHRWATLPVGNCPKLIFSPTTDGMRAHSDCMCCLCGDSSTTKHKRCQLARVGAIWYSSSSSSWSLSHFYVGSIWDDSRLHAARSYTSSPDSPFSLRSSFTQSVRLFFGLPLLLPCTSIPITLFPTYSSPLISSHLLISSSPLITSRILGPSLKSLPLLCFLWSSRFWSCPT